MNRDEICSWLETHFPDEEFLLADGLEEAFVGVDDATKKTMYNSEICIDIYMKDGMSYEEALEYFEFNVIGAYAGEKTPVFLNYNNYED
jgi:hypothetical protein